MTYSPCSKTQYFILAWNEACYNSYRSFNLNKNKKKLFGENTRLSAIRLAECTDSAK